MGVFYRVAISLLSTIQLHAPTLPACGLHYCFLAQCPSNSFVTAVCTPRTYVPVCDDTLHDFTRLSHESHRDPCCAGKGYHTYDYISLGGAAGLRQ